MPTPLSASAPAGAARSHPTSSARRAGSRSDRPSSRAVSKARNELLAQLKEDHQRVKKAYAKYRRLDGDEDADTREALVQQVLDELTLHAQLEETLLYPAAREAMEDTDQIDEAVVEHEMLHVLIDQLRALEAGGNEQRARFTVLCEYTLHHVKEEEREMFPQLMKVKLDWLALSREFEAQRAAHAMADDDPAEPEASEASADLTPDTQTPGTAEAAELPVARGPSGRRRAGAPSAAGDAAASDENGSGKRRANERTNEREGENQSAEDARSTDEPPARKAKAGRSAGPRDAQDEGVTLPPEAEQPDTNEDTNEDDDNNNDATPDRA